MKRKPISDLKFGCLVVLGMAACVLAWFHFRANVPEAGGRSRDSRQPRAAPQLFPDDPIPLEDFPKIVALRRLLDTIEQVESGGDCRAVGDGGRSRGPLQCGKLAWLDALEFAGIPADDSGWNYDKWVWDRAKSRQVFIWYTTRWKANTLEERARCWNSGPEWKEKYHLTDDYWRKVREVIK